jgi:hypothetical protein
MSSCHSSGGASSSSSSSSSSPPSFGSPSSSASLIPSNLASNSSPSVGNAVPLLDDNAGDAGTLPATLTAALAACNRSASRSAFLINLCPFRSRRRAAVISSEVRPVGEEGERRWVRTKEERGGAVLTAAGSPSLRSGKASLAHYVRTLRSLRSLQFCFESPSCSLVIALPPPHPLKRKEKGSTYVSCPPRVPPSCSLRASSTRVHSWTRTPCRRTPGARAGPCPSPP